MTRMAKANEKGLEEVCKAVLEPHFHADGVAPRKVNTTLPICSLGGRKDWLLEGSRTPRAASALRHG